MLDKGKNIYGMAERDWELFLKHFFCFDVYEVNEGSKEVTCLGYNGEVYKFSFPVQVEQSSLLPGELERLIMWSQRKQRPGWHWSKRPPFGRK